MFFLYGTITTGILGMLMYNFIKYLFFPKLKSFDDEYRVQDEYTLFCYRIKYEDGKEDVENDELAYDDLKVMNENNKIKYIIIDYMFNNKFMKYITYDMNIDFPIYDVDINIGENREIIDTVLLNDIDITAYVTPFLGPKENFYKDLNIKMYLKDILEEHPEIDTFDFDNGNLKMKAMSGKVIEYTLPWSPVWKPFSGFIDNTSDITDYINDNNHNSKYGFAIINTDVLN